MGRRHAKNSHSSPFFSYEEKQKLDYGSKKQRIGAESFRKFDACMLCNSTVRGPVACPDGHIFCKECILESLLTQKKLIKAHEIGLARQLEDEKAEQERARADARERVVRDFQRGQSALGARTVGGSTTVEVVKVDEKNAGEGERGTKRKFELDSSELDRLAQAAEDAAMVKISSEQAEARKAKLPAFWLPSLAPVAGKEKVKVVKLETMCQASEHPHPLKQKNLIEVKFTPLPSSSTSSTTAGKSNPSSCMCPACSKELTNSTQSVLLKGCGHVVCKKCCDEIVRPGKQCVQCDGVVGEKGLIELVRDGTGYAAAGGAQAVKKGVAFQ